MKQNDGKQPGIKNTQRNQKAHWWLVGEQILNRNAYIYSPKDMEKPVISATLEAQAGGLWVKANPGKISKTLSQKKVEARGLGHGSGGRAQEALGLIPSTAKEKWKKTGIKVFIMV
jgi:hypothetical protein